MKIEGQGATGIGGQRCCPEILRFASCRIAKPGDSTGIDNNVTQRRIGSLADITINLNNSTETSVVDCEVIQQRSLGINSMNTDDA